MPESILRDFASGFGLSVKKPSLARRLFTYTSFSSLSKPWSESIIKVSFAVILEYISPNKVLDFGKDVFPQMIQNDESIFGVIFKGGLTAIDTPFLYKQISNNINK